MLARAWRPGRALPEWDAQRRSVVLAQSGPPATAGSVWHLIDVSCVLPLDVSMDLGDAARLTCDGDCREVAGSHVANSPFAPAYSTLMVIVGGARLLSAACAALPITTVIVCLPGVRFSS